MIDLKLYVKTNRIYIKLMGFYFIIGDICCIHWSSESEYICIKMKDTAWGFVPAGVRLLSDTFLTTLIIALKFYVDFTILE